MSYSSRILVITLAAAGFACPNDRDKTERREQNILQLQPVSSMPDKPTIDAVDTSSQKISYVLPKIGPECRVLLQKIRVAVPWEQLEFASALGHVDEAVIAQYQLSKALADGASATSEEFWVDRKWFSPVVDFYVPPDRDQPALLGVSIPGHGCNFHVHSSDLKHAEIELETPLCDAAYGVRTLRRRHPSEADNEFVRDRIRQNYHELSEIDGQIRERAKSALWHGGNATDLPGDSAFAIIDGRGIEAELPPHSPCADLSRQVRRFRHGVELKPGTE